MTKVAAKRGEGMPNYQVWVSFDVTTGHFEAWCPELPGCRAMGCTVEEARASLDEARELYLSALAEEGMPVPPPRVLVPKDGAVIWGLRND